MKRVVTVELTCTYDFDEKEYPMDKYDNEAISDIAYEWWFECVPTIYVETDDED